jgi:phage tail sheath protein FI
MPRPGTQIDIVDDAPFGGAVLDSGQAFFVGVTERGPVGDYERVQSLSQYAALYGGRTGGSLMYDSAGAYFAEGGAELIVSRVSGANADVATIAFGSATANAASPGVWGNGVKLDAVGPTTLAERVSGARTAARRDAGDPRIAGDPIAVTVTLGGKVVERSNVVASVDELVTWAQEHSNLVRFVRGADNTLPAAGTSATLAGGADDNAVDATTIGAALDALVYELGPGQVCAPGLTSTAAHDALLAHASACRRNALLDLPDTSDALVLSAAVAALDDVDGVRFAAAFAPWVVYPAQTSPATVTIPYSGVQAGLIARSDAATGNPNVPAAGANGISRMALGLSQTYSDDVREALNVAGVDVAILKYGTVRTYGYRSAAGPDDPNWLWYGGARELNALAHESDAIAENYVLRQIDGQGALFASLHNDLKGMCLEHYRRGALYGVTPDEAFAVDTGSTVNTPATIAAGEVHAVVRAKTSPAAEWVQISIVKVPIERSLAVAA